MDNNKINLRNGTQLYRLLPFGAKRKKKGLDHPEKKYLMNEDVLSQYEHRHDSEKSKAESADFFPEHYLEIQDTKDQICTRKNVFTGACRRHGICEELEKQFLGSSGQSLRDVRKFLTTQNILQEMFLI